MKVCSLAPRKEQTKALFQINSEHIDSSCNLLVPKRRLPILGDSDGTLEGTSLGMNDGIDDGASDGDSLGNILNDGALLGTVLGNMLIEGA